ncbi:MAG: Uncharacterised protein [Synechococcus sp. CC9902]|nr:MAG: Uncharacterised protein [Synechococcus sp. CC9902]
MGSEQHFHHVLSHLCALDTSGLFATAKAAVFCSPWAISPEFFEFDVKNMGQFCTVQAQQVIHIAAGCGVTGITVDARAREVGASGDHDISVEDDKFVVHESTAATSIFGVIQHWNSGFL